MWNSRRRISLLPEFALAVILMGLFPLRGNGQNTMPFREEITLKAGDTVQLKTVRVSPFSTSLTCNGSPLDSLDYALDAYRGRVALKNSAYDGKTIVVQGRYFPRFFQPGYALRLHTSDTANQNIAVIPDYFPGAQVIFEPSALRKSGSISRGVSVGNNQNLSVTSGLRLQVEGELGDGLKIVAAITDENIPIQPDGTTQQIQDFDKVFIQLEKKNDNIILGDFEIIHKGTLFADFYRNVQGAGIRVQDQKNLTASVNAAVAKGKFNTNSFQGRDGIQGPYRLTGKNNERFIIVLAGSEKVYVNGQLMLRGETNDYIIDYNSGELTFTTNRVITSASRIVVDFEYTDRFYNRSLLFTDVSDKFFKERLDFRFSYGRDADNQNAPVEEQFSEEELDTLSSIGDDRTRALVSGVDSVGPTDSDNLIRYERKDTTIGVTVFERYVYTGSRELSVYQLSFSFVGTGQGFYVKDASGINGTIFRWVPPDATGKPTGDYAPVKQLVLPRLLQVADMGLGFRITKKIKLYTEFAVSSEDLNRFSDVNDSDNIDIANKTGVLVDQLKVGDSTFLKIDVSQKYVGMRYNNLDRINKVEYGREWNFDDLGTRLTERISEGIVELRVRNRLKLTVNAGVRTFGTTLGSVKQLYKAESSHKLLQGNYTFTTISTDNAAKGIVSVWDRHNGDVSKHFWKLQPGTEIWMENKRDALGDSLADGSFRFYDFKPYLKSWKTEMFQFHVYYNYRREYEKFDSLYRDKSVAHTEYARLNFSPLDNLNLQTTASLRNFRLLDTAFVRQGLTDQRTVMTNLQGNYASGNRFIFANMVYEVSSEQLARKEVAFLEVNPGQGQWEWIDENGDNIQQVTEFFSSAYNPTSPANYIRVMIPTRELFPTTSLDFSGNLKLEFKNLLDRSDHTLTEIIRNFSSITTFRATQKKNAGNEFSNYIINLQDIFADTSLLDAQYNFRQDWYFFRNNSTGDFRVTYSDSRSRQFLTTGDETRSYRYWGSEQRLNFGKSKSIENEVKLGTKLSAAELLTNRNFNIRFFEALPKVNFQISRKFRLTAGYEFKHKVNSSDTVAVVSSVDIHKVSLDAKLNLKDRNNIFAKFQMANVLQDGTGGFAADFEMRESLQPGVNYIWQLFTTYYLSQNLELSVTYDGRASEGNPVLHTGRVQVKAFF